MQFVEVTLGTADYYCAKILPAILFLVIEVLHRLTFYVALVDIITCEGASCAFFSYMFSPLTALVPQIARTILTLGVMTDMLGLHAGSNRSNGVAFTFSNIGHLVTTVAFVAGLGYLWTARIPRYDGKFGHLEAIVLVYTFTSCGSVLTRLLLTAGVSVHKRVTRTAPLASLRKTFFAVFLFHPTRFYEFIGRETLFPIARYKEE